MGMYIEYICRKILIRNIKPELVESIAKEILDYKFIDGVDVPIIRKDYKERLLELKKLEAIIYEGLNEGVTYKNMPHTVFVHIDNLQDFHMLGHEFIHILQSKIFQSVNTGQKEQDVLLNVYKKGKFFDKNFLVCEDKWEEQMANDLSSKAAQTFSEYTTESKFFKGDDTKSVLKKCPWNIVNIEGYITYRRFKRSLEDQLYVNTLEAAILDEGIELENFLDILDERREENSMDYSDINNYSL
ncbi:MAG TPA: hypothetical protein DEP72_08025 [Clostridiales bacterium]|nr:MAG: hypothetical protein A2Y18_01150 [Clostridiales bacterium GWD2_32_19]HCC08083.1 hypothetical protein [Clostridiales bacterium]